MNTNKSVALAKRWGSMIGTVLNLDRVPSDELQFLLKDTYEKLYFYQKSDTIPKELAKLLLEMNEYLYFSTLIEDKEDRPDFYYYRAVSSVVKALTDGFFAGNYECSFPLLNACNAAGFSCILDLENGSLEELML